MVVGKDARIPRTQLLSNGPYFWSYTILLRTIAELFTLQVGVFEPYLVTDLIEEAFLEQELDLILIRENF